MSCQLTARPAQWLALIHPVMMPVEMQTGRQWHKDVVSRRFKGPVLGYVTPW